jgi:hypothetical protein
MTKPQQVQSLKIQSIWPEGLAENPQVVNQFVIANDPAGPEGVYLVFGHLASPVWLSEEHAEQRLKQLGGALTINGRGAFYMTRANAERLRQILDTHLKKDEK